VEPDPDLSAQTGRRESLASSAVATFATQVIGAVVSLGNVLIVARALGPEGRGSVAYLSTIAFLSAQLCSLGIQQANSNLGAARPRLRPALAANTLVLSLVLGTLAIVALAAAMALVPALQGETSANERWLALGSIPIHVATGAFLALVQAAYGFRAANIAWLASPILTVSINAALAAAGHLSVGASLAAWIIGQALGGVLLATYFVRSVAPIGRPDARVARESLAFGIRAHGGRAMMLGNYRLDQWFVGAIAGSRELGLYSVAVAWAEALFYLPTALAAVQRPDLVRASRGDAAQLAARLFRIAVLVTVPFAVALVLLAPVLCVDVFGGDFRGSVDDLRILAGGSLGIVALKLLGNSLTAQRRPLLETAAIGVAFAVGVVLDLILIPHFGGAGAAAASTIAYTAGGVAAMAIFLRALGGRAGSLVPHRADAKWFSRFVGARFRRAEAGE
jgi:O-antigen/teichoic acid export membrane protein